MDDLKLTKLLKEHKKEINRHFDVVAEGLKHEIHLLAEQVNGNTTKLKNHDSRFDVIDEKLETIQTDLFFIKNELKQKVSHEEFAILEKRVNLLESKLNRQK